MFQRFALAVLSCGLLWVSAAWSQTHRGRELTEVALVADSATIVPGRPITLGLHMKKAEGWHTYWEFSGDAGLATEVEWDLPAGFRVSGLEWPLPHRFIEPGDIQVNGYKEETLLMARLFPPLRIEGGEVTLRARASWLICEAICIPGEADLSLTLRVAERPEPSHVDLFQRFRAQLPLRTTPPFGVSWERQGDLFQLTLTGVAEGKPDFFPLPPDEADAGHPRVQAKGSQWVISLPVQNVPAGWRALDGVLVLEREGKGAKTRQGWRLGPPGP